MTHLIKIVVVFLMIGCLVYIDGIDFQVFSQVGKDSYLVLGIALIIFLLIVFLGGLKWFLLIRAVDVPISLSQCFKIHMIGTFFMFYLPGGATGSAMIKAYFVHKETRGASNLALMSIFIDSIMGVYSLIIVGVVLICINYQVPIGDPIFRWNLWIYVIIFTFSSSIIWLLFTRRSKTLFNSGWINKFPFNKFLDGFLSAIEIYRGKLIPLCLTLVLNMILHIMMIFVFYFSALALNFDIPLSLHSHIVPLLLLINLIPIAPGGLGVGEVASFAIYNMAGVEGGGEIFLLFHVYLFITSVLGAPFYFSYKYRQDIS